MIDEILNFLLGLIDHTYDNGSDADEKLKMILREKARLKRLRKKS